MICCLNLNLKTLKVLRLNVLLVINQFEIYYSDLKKQQVVVDSK